MKIKFVEFIYAGTPGTIPIITETTIQNNRLGFEVYRFPLNASGPYHPKEGELLAPGVFSTAEEALKVGERIIRDQFKQIMIQYEKVNKALKSEPEKQMLKAYLTKMCTLNYVAKI